MNARGQIQRERFITRSMVRAMPNALFVFGDNMVGRGLGGQAAAMRGEPNVVGIPTKWRPERTPGAYFSDGDWQNGDVRHAILGAFERIEAALATGQNVVIPANGVGSGLAQLPMRAPKIHAYIERRIASLSGGQHA